MESSSDRGIWVMGFDKIPLLRINTSDTISKDALTWKGQGSICLKELNRSESPKIVSLVRSCVFLFEQVIWSSERKYVGDA